MACCERTRFAEIHHPANQDFGKSVARGPRRRLVPEIVEFQRILLEVLKLAPRDDGIHR